MALRFTIIDYTNTGLPVSTVVDEPIGWDNITLRLKRDKTWHGFFDFADDRLGALTFIGKGYDILKTAFDNFGVEAHVQLQVEYACSETDSFQRLYLGRVVFSKYEEQCGDLCGVEVGLEAANCLMMFKNRYDQQVDLDSLLPFDKCNCGDTLDVHGSFTVFENRIYISSVDGYTIADLSCLKAYNQIEITNSTSNNGIYTILSVTVEPLPRIILTVAETLTDETFVTYTISGCLLAQQLPAYDTLGAPITIPAKTIFLESKAQSTEVTTLNAIQNPGVVGYPTGALPDGTGGYRTGSRAAWFTLASNVTQNDLSTFDGSIYQYVPNGIRDDSNPSGIFKLDLLPICPSFDVRIQISFTGTFENTGSANRLEDLKFIMWIGDSAYNYGGTAFSNIELYGFTGSVPDTQSFTYSFDQTVNIAAGKSLFYYFAYSCLKSDNGANDPVITINNDFVINLSSHSKCNSTPARFYMVNETLSRCAEAYTNDCLRVYSDYYGRTDALPYPSDVDGCGALRAVTNGLQIRNAPNSDGETPHRVTVSMQDMFNALNAVDNIGMGIEEDLNRGGDLIRIEPQEHFYNNDVVLTCHSIHTVKRKADPALIYSTIKTGYQKWKTWNINGLNDIFTPREYRTQLDEIKNELDKTCKFIASDYAVEWTRRQFGLTTADSRYDNDIFMLCLTREPYVLNVTGMFTTIGPNNILIIQGQSWPIAEGDQIQITGSLSNDFTFTVLAVENFWPGNTALALAEPITPESLNPFTITSVNVPLRVEQGVDFAVNIINPDTVMNYRIAPSRNAMRWLKTVLQSYRHYLGGVMQFTAGEANLLATGKVAGGCILENHAIKENQDISLPDFDNRDANCPLFWPELVEFEYPVSYDEYLLIKNNPYGLIGYQCGDGDIQYGWIEDFQLTPYTGMGKFALRPKIPV